MNVFPQLLSGSIAMLPSYVSRITRTASNELTDGSVVALADPDAVQMRWKLQFRGLTKTEWLTLDHFVADHHGGVDGFIFLDPFTNLDRKSTRLNSSH